MIPAIRPRQDTDRCGCLDCRGVDATVLRRSTLDSLVWSVSLCRRNPSIPALALGLVLAGQLLNSGLAQSAPAPVVDLTEPLVPFGLLVVLRGYVAGVAAGELTGQQVSLSAGLRHSFRRGIALVGVLAVVVAFAISVPSIVTLPLLVGAFVSGVNPMATFGVESVFVALLALHVVPLLFVLYACWFAFEACVIGRYGPVDSLRVSWAITRGRKRKFLLVLVATAGSIAVTTLIGDVPGTGGRFLPSGPVTRAVAASLGELTAIVWYGVYAHLYVQETVRR
ncbi:hypothetical protein [Halosimplex sp. TS25]|uniref:DUF7847 domain-containing protein n=1 Tax=Halosimplex rarum TaxID=3396619 RepID=UPI0039E9C31B